MATPETEKLIPSPPTAGGHKYSWDWRGENRVALLRDGEELVSCETRFASRDGLQLCDAATATQPDSAQASDHGAGRRSVQLIRAGQIVADLNLA